MALGKELDHGEQNSQNSFTTVMGFSLQKQVIVTVAALKF